MTVSVREVQPPVNHCNRPACSGRLGSCFFGVHDAPSKHSGGTDRILGLIVNCRGKRWRCQPYCITSTLWAWNGSFPRGKNPATVLGAQIHHISNSPLANSKSQAPGTWESETQKDAALAPCRTPFAPAPVTFQLWWPKFAFNQVRSLRNTGDPARTSTSCLVIFRLPTTYYRRLLSLSGSRYFGSLQQANDGGVAPDCTVLLHNLDRAS